MVDILLMPVKYVKKIILTDYIIDRLPNRLVLFSSVQFTSQLADIKRQLEEKGKSIMMNKSKNYLYNGMVTENGSLLGCNLEDYSKKNISFDAFLYIGDGMFHPKALLINNNKDVYCYNPINNSIKILSKNIHDKYVRKARGVLMKFLSSKNIGLLITTKIGQANPKRAELLRERIIKRWPDKRIFTFYASDIKFSELENYNFIDIYINVACPRIGQDDEDRTEKPIINIQDVERLLDDN